jgi:hypothetical protein
MYRSNKQTFYILYIVDDIELNGVVTNIVLNVVNSRTEEACEPN